jgi:sugar-specific transcriptional regulator TrmB
MKQQINAQPLPHMGGYVRNIMKQQQISAKTLARKANISRDNIYKLLRSEQWSLFNIRLIGFILKVNLFRLYVPEFSELWQQERQALQQSNQQLQNSNTQLQSDNKNMEEKNHELLQTVQQLQLEKENELLREVSGLRKAS